MDKNTQKQAYFVGIGGIGVSSLARWYLAQNWAVSGSDGSESIITQELRNEGVNVKIGHKTANLPAKVDLLIHSQAISPENPELKEALRRHIPCLSYPQAIGELTRQYRTVAVAGAHGKSTTTSLVGIIAHKNKLDPTLIVGVKLKEFGGRNFRLGASDLLVLEADEYGKAFFNYTPSIAVITNIDREHLEIYNNLANIKRAFLKFLSNVRTGGVFILNRDNEHLYSLKTRIEKLAEKKSARVVWYSKTDSCAKKIKAVLKIPGEHNLSNAIAAYHAGKTLGLREAALLKSIGSFRGAWRRLELKGSYGGALVYDDYAHHPTEIRASLAGLREKYPKKKILCVFQPHQGKRLAALFGQFKGAFDLADATLILPVYQVAGRDSLDPSFSSKALVRAIQKTQPKKPLFYLSKPDQLVNALSTLAAPRSKHVIVMMGAGDIVNRTTELLAANFMAQEQKVPSAVKPALQL